MEKEVEVKEKKHIKIEGITLWRIVAYFIIYSVAGFIIETIFGVLTKGVLESRKSFLYGPFCAIYGLGAVVMILCLQPFKKNNNTSYIDFSYLVNEDIVLKRLTLHSGDNVINYKYGVYDSNYVKNDYYVEKKLDNMGITNIDLVNKCYGDTINKDNIRIKNDNYQGVKLRYNGLLTIYIKTDNTFIDKKEMLIVIPYNNYETVIIPNEEEL